MTFTAFGSWVMFDLFRLDPGRDGLLLERRSENVVLIKRHSGHTKTGSPSNCVANGTTGRPAHRLTRPKKGFTRTINQPGLNMRHVVEPDDRVGIPIPTGHAVCIVGDRFIE